MRALVLLALAGAAAAQVAPPQSAPSDPVVLYEAGRFDSAADVFAEQSKASPGDPIPHFNRGNALFKAGRLGPALASYLRAYDLDPRDEDIRFNLDFALRKAGDALYPPGVPQPLWLLYHALSLRELAGLQWLFYWAAIGLLALRLVSGEKRREALLLPLVAAFGLWTTTLGWWALRRAGDPVPLAVTVQPRTELRNGPGDAFSVGFTAPEGRRVRVLQERGDWVEIGVLKEGVKGWVLADSVERV